jgi:hypothetical protein
MRQQLKPLAWLAVAMLLLHWAALGGLQWAWPQRVATPLPADAMQVRVVAPAPARVPEEAAARPIAPVPESLPVPQTVAATSTVASPAATATKPAALATSRPRLRPPETLTLVFGVAKPPTANVATGHAAAPMSAPPKVAVAAPPSPFMRVSTGADTAPVGIEPATRDSVSPGDETIPHYRTQVPPAVLLRYELRRGGLSGSGDLLWRPDGDRYALQLDGRVGPLAVLTQVSIGGFDAAGLAPVRFTDRRLRRPTSAANFERDAGKITFSGPATELALHAGVQDRLSWMVQLAAIIAAEPALRIPDAKVVIGVVGVHADAAVWALRCIGREPVETDAGVIDAIKYMREPRDPYDTTVQVWLDPKRHYLPVQATQKSGTNDEGYSLRLLEVSAVP